MGRGQRMFSFVKEMWAQLILIVLGSAITIKTLLYLKSNKTNRHKRDV